MSDSPTKTLRGKFVRVLLFVSTLIGISTLVIVLLMSAQASSEYLKQVQGHIEEGIISKGRVLTQNHALALRSLTQDNAFLDMQHLVDRAVQEDQDVAYGVFVNSERATLARSKRGVAPQKDDLPEKDAWKQLGLAEDELLVKALTVKHANRLGKDLLEVAAPVTSEDGESLGTIPHR